MAVDTNALIQALDFNKLNELDAALAGKSPVVSITATKEYLKKGDSAALRDFLVSRDGRIGKAATREEIDDLTRRVTEAVTPSGQVRKIAPMDASVAASAIKENLPLMSRDNRLIKVLEAIVHQTMRW